MGQVIAGDLLEATCKHPDLGTSTFLCKAAEDGTFELGGFRTSDDANNTDGGGRNIKVMNRRRWEVGLTITNDMNTNNDIQKLSDLADNPKDGEWTISHKNFSVWRGTGSPVGDIEANTNAGTIEFSLMGGGKLKKIQG